MQNVKILILGPGGVGKTTIKKVFFEHENPFSMINTTIEPTVGVETSYFSLNSTIAVHDMAGQQLDLWLSQPEANFIGTDLIIAMFDCRTDFLENASYFERIHNVGKNFCTDAHIYFLLHKIDLLKPDQRTELDEKCNTFFSKMQNASYHLTSISSTYYIETFKLFLSLLRDYMSPIQTISFKESTLKIELLNAIKDGGEYKLPLIAKTLKKEENLDVIAAKLSLDQLITFDPDNKIIKITDNGITLIKKIQKKITIAIKGSESGSNVVVGGLILSDIHGRTFYAYQDKSDYFSSLFPGNPSSNDSITTLISMFFTAINDFGESIDESGISTINLSGEYTKIISITYRNLFGIVFLKNLNIDKSVQNFLNGFFRHIHQKFESKLQFFMDSGNLKTFDGIHLELFPMIRDLDKNLATLNDLNEDMTQNSLFNLFKNINEENYDQIDFILIKKLIFKQLLLENSNIIDHLPKSK